MHNEVDNHIRILFPSIMEKPPLFEIFEQSFNLEFIQDDGKQSRADARIVIESSDEIKRISNDDIHTYAFVKSENILLQSFNKQIDINFSGSPFTPKSFRNKDIIVLIEKLYSTFALPSGYDEISSIRGSCIWAIKKSKHHYHYLVGTDLPNYAHKQPFFKIFGGERFYEVLPLIDFIRRITKNIEYSHQRSFASIIFDDPNIHLSRYGFIRFREIAHRAEIYNYHAAIASIPLDLFFACNKTVKIFTDHSDRLSLLIHGNNHLSYELMRDYNEHERKSLLSQALSRVLKFEQKYGLHFSKIMIAPHGSCTEEMFHSMVQYGFEGACVSFNSIYNGNKNRDWTLKLGTLSSSLISGLPVLDRFRFNSPDCRIRILLAAYMERPIILYGHSPDLKFGFDVLENAVEIVNELSDYEWTDIKTIARRNYLVKQCDNIFNIELFSRLAELEIPAGVEWVRLNKPTTMNGSCFEKALIIQNGNSSEFSAFSELIAVNEGDILTISFPIDKIPAGSSRPRKSTTVKAIVRRIATESRDQIQPLPRHFIRLIKQRSTKK